ncbi:MAG TPA: response regulator [Chloroflexota bacterium]|nr:response regulator [Chloroflexota bacterium]HEX2986946.1 response regulator [Chloroflexota bacterium]
MASTDRAVLVVDDDAELLGMLQMILAEAGYRVITAGEGHEALEKVEQELPGVILLDMKMPGMDGWEFAREFRARYGRSSPIVVLTASEDARERAEEIDAECHVGKPFEIPDLLKVVESQLHTRA